MGRKLPTANPSQQIRSEVAKGAISPDLDPDLGPSPDPWPDPGWTLKSGPKKGARNRKKSAKSRLFWTLGQTRNSEFFRGKVRFSEKRRKTRKKRLFRLQNRFFRRYTLGQDGISKQVEDDDFHENPVSLADRALQLFGTFQKSPTWFRIETNHAGAGDSRPRGRKIALSKTTGKRRSKNGAQACFQVRKTALGEDVQERTPI